MLQLRKVCRRASKLSARAEYSKGFGSLQWGIRRFAAPFCGARKSDGLSPTGLGLVLLASLFLLLAFFLFACSKSGKLSQSFTSKVSSDGSNSNTAKTDPNNFVPKSAIGSELYTKLLSEFERLGIDPVRAVAKAPIGSVNAVFDFKARLAGDAGEQPASVVLTWTEQLTGDYDQNGEVGIPDITPIALSYLKRAQYETQILWTGGKRPVGDPDDDGGAAPGELPAAGSGAENWRLARVDGDFNGEIGISDVTPIALHYLQRLDGHRVYRKRLGESSYTLLPNPDSPSSSLTIPRAATFPEGATSPDTSRPVRYMFTDADAGEGIVIYYTTAFDIVSGQEGPPSNGIAINTATGEVEDALKANLTVTPDYGPAPLEVTFDATSSIVQGGQIAEFKFDFDGDGKIDYSTRDAEPPPASSTGKAVEITPGNNPGVVTARFVYGDSDFINCSVTILDDSGLESSPATATLGVSYWEREIIPSGQPFMKIWHRLALSTDPATGEVIIYGAADTSSMGVLSGSAYISWRKSPGVWETETIIDPDDTRFDWANWAKMALFWNHENRPVAIVLLANAGMFNYTGKLYSAERMGKDNWIVELIFEGSAPIENTDRGPFDISGPAVIAPDEAAFIITDLIQFPGVHQFIVLWHKRGEWSIEDTGLDSYKHKYMNDLCVGPDGKLYCRIPHIVEPDFNNTNTLWILRRDGAIDWHSQRLDNGEIRDIANGRIVEFSFTFGPDGLPYFAAVMSSTLYGNDLFLGYKRDGLIHFWEAQRNIHSMNSYNPATNNIVGNKFGVATISSTDLDAIISDEDIPRAAAWFDRIVNGALIQELAFFETNSVYTESVVEGPIAITSDSKGNDYGIAVYNPRQEDFKRFAYLLIRQDPKISQ